MTDDEPKELRMVKIAEMNADDEHPKLGGENLDTSQVSAPRKMDGSPVDKDEAARVHAGLTSGEMDVKMTPEVIEQMEKLGLSAEDMRKLLIAATRKTMN